MQSLTQNVVMESAPVDSGSRGYSVLHTERQRGISEVNRRNAAAFRPERNTQMGFLVRKAPLYLSEKLEFINKPKSLSRVSLILLLSARMHPL